MPSQPLSYESLKLVLQYMEPNKRLLVSSKCPTIATTERLVPLKIDSLTFSRGIIQLNDTRFKIGITRHYYMGPTPFTIRKSNDKGGVPYDVDRFGIEIEEDEFAVMPGDVEMVREEMLEGSKDDEVIRELIETVDGWKNSLQRKPNSSIEEYLDEDEVKLDAYQHRRYAVEPTYEHLIQLTVTSEPGKSMYFEQYKKNKKYSEAMRQLATFLFDRRRPPIQVNRLSVSSNIVRLPAGVQFKVREIHFNRLLGAGMDALKPIIHESSLPIKHIEARDMELVDLTHSIVRGALSLAMTDSFEPDMTLLRLMTATNQRVKLTSLYRPITSEQAIALIENWIETDRSIGTHFLFRFSKHDALFERIEAICNRFNVQIGDKKHVIVPMTDAKQFKFYATGKQSSWLHMVVEAAEMK